MKGIRRQMVGRGFVWTIGGSPATVHAWRDRRLVEDAHSEHSAAAVGMVQEGVLRQNLVEKGEIVDEACCGILRTEWEAHKESTT